MHVSASRFARSLVRIGARSFATVATWLAAGLPLAAEESPLRYVRDAQGAVVAVVNEQSRTIPVRPRPVDHPALSYLQDARGGVIAIVNAAARREPAAPAAALAAPARGAAPAAVAGEKARAFLAETASAFGIGDAEAQLREGGATQDRLGMTHVVYEQVHRGVPVMGAGLIAHLNDAGEVVSVNGRTLAGLELDPAPALTADQAAGIARSLAGLRFAESPATPPVLRVINMEFLGLAKSSADVVSRLVWEVTLSGPNDASPAYSVDAVDGTLVHFDSGEGHLTRQIYDCALVNPITPGCRLDISWYFESTDERYTLGRSEGQPARGAMPVGAGPPYAGSLDVDNGYNHFLPSIHQYFADRFGRDGANDRGGTGNGTSVPFATSRMFVHANGEPTYGALFCNPGYAWAGTTSVVFCAGSLSPATYDLLGHEYGHLVSRYRSFNANGTPNTLLSTGPAGALNEGVSDVYGELFEYYMTGSNNWILGGGANIQVFRNIVDPPSLFDPFHGMPFPDRFNSPDFYCGTSDAGGIHHNSTVPSKAAYLTAMGGSFNGCTISGLGREKMEQIWYRATVNYYANSETFNGAYQGLIQACHDLYSAADCAELTKALQAVEMDQAGRCSGLPALPATCAPTPQLRTELAPDGVRFLWGAEATRWTLQCGPEPGSYTDVQTITGAGEYLVPFADAAKKFCRLRY